MVLRGEGEEEELENACNVQQGLEETEWNLRQVDKDRGVKKRMTKKDGREG